MNETEPMHCAVAASRITFLDFQSPTKMNGQEYTACYMKDRAVRSTVQSWHEDGLCCDEEGETGV